MLAWSGVESPVNFGGPCFRKSVSKAYISGWLAEDDAGGFVAVAAAAAAVAAKVASLEACSSSIAA